MDFSKRGALFPRKKDLVWGQAFDILGNCLLFAPKHGDPTHIQLMPSYQAHPLASAPPHVEVFYLREQVLFISTWEVCGTSAPISLVIIFVDHWNEIKALEAYLYLASMCRWSFVLMWVILVSVPWFIFINCYNCPW